MTRRLTIGLFVLLGFLMACNTGGTGSGAGEGSGGGGGGGPVLLVADSGNNRVLQYTALATGQAAVVALGQTTLFGGAPNQGLAAPTPATLSGPQSVALDSGGNLWVSDSDNCRVVKFPQPFTTAENASVALGQLDKTSACLGVASATILGHTGGIALDTAGNLWVADTQNNRVLKFPLGSLAADGSPAALAIGQPVAGNLTSTGVNNPALGARSLNGPSAVAFDSTGNLWVVDKGNNRVLMYPPGSQVAGGAATVELGQPFGTAFTSNGPNNPILGAATLNAPTAIAFDLTGNAWVTDTGNNRVLSFPKPALGFTAAFNGEVATIELGQPAVTPFTSNLANNPVLGGDSLSGPAGIVFDSGGRAIVTDAGNNRTLVYPFPLFTNEAATIAIGQPDLTHGGINNPALGPTTQFAPKGLFTTF